jgi:hypothetical protein
MTDMTGETRHIFAAEIRDCDQVTMDWRQSLLIQISTAFLLLVCSGTLNAEVSELDALLNQLIAEYGGEENLRKLDNQIQEWEIVTLVGARHGYDMRSVRVPDQLKVEITYPDKQETRVVNGDSAYFMDRDALPHLATKPQKDAMRLQLMRHYSPLVLRNKRDSLSVVIEGKYRVITLFEEGVRADYFVNSENRRIEKVVGGLAIRGTEMQFVTEYSDFKVHEGVLVHQKENKFAGGVNTAKLKLRSITLDANLTEADFVPDHGKFVKPRKEKSDVI